jgi:hypothetical protein
MTIVDPTDYLYEPGSGLEVPGIEAVLEYGDESTYTHGAIPGALRVNDRSRPDQIHVRELTGLHDDPDVGDSRVERAGSWGERSGILLPRGRTVGVTGDVRSNSVPRMRDLWRRLRSQFGRVERDLIIHPPNEPAFYINELSSRSPSGWTASRTSTTGGSLAAPVTFTDGTLAGIEQGITQLSSPANQVSLTSTAIPWSGEDVWVCALIDVSAAAAATSNLVMQVLFLDAAGATVTTWTPATVASPSVGAYTEVRARMAGATMANVVSAVVRFSLNVPSTDGTYKFRVGRLTVSLLRVDEASPSGYLDGFLPGFEWEGVVDASRSYGPCYTVNQVRDVAAATIGWANDSTAGATVSSAGGVVHGWPEVDRTANSWVIVNPSTTSRTLAVRTPVSLVDPNLFVVAAGRRYRGHVRALVQQSYAIGALQIVWLDKAGATVSTSTLESFDPVAAGGAAQDVYLDGVATAPATASRAYMRLAALTASTTTNDQLKVLISEPRFIDVSEYDPGEDARIDDTQEAAYGLAVSTVSRAGSDIVETPSGARRRIPRPFLLRRVRALWDGKAPESQRNLQARRDFTFSLRAGDPRIYVREQRHSALRITGTPSLISYSTTALSQSLDALAWTNVGYEDFSGATAGNPLNGRVASIGGAVWATSGDTTDFTFATGIIGNTVNRATIGDGGGRFAALGSTVYTDVELEVDFYRDANVSGTGSTATGVQQGIFLRYVDASNYVRAVFFNPKQGGVHTPSLLNIYQVVGGVETRVASVNADSVVPSAFYELHATAYLSGLIVAQIFDGLGALVATAYAATPEMERGGVLSSGLVGIYDRHNAISGGTVTRSYDDFFVSTASISNSAAPTGFTYEGSSLAPDVQWRTRSLGSIFPRDGVTLGWNESYPPTSGYLTADSLARMYYSAGSLTYATPQVTVVGNCISGQGFDYDLFADSLVGGAWQYNYIGALLKRVSSSAWIEVRYNSANQAAMLAAHSTPTPPTSLELWSSHGATGSAGVTKLAGWDVPTGNIIDGHLKHVRAYMDASDVVYVELWDQDPNLNDVGLIARHSFQMASGLAAVVGHTVAGRAGMMTRLARWDDGTHVGVGVSEMQLNYDTPYLSSFEALDYSTALLLIGCPVIGDADDVPLQVVLRGDIDTPSIVLINRDTGETYALRLSGVFPESDPVTVDLDAGTIRSASGVNYRSRRVVGSRFFSLSPGQNVLAVQAVGWNSSAPAHVIATWRDALK